LNFRAGTLIGTGFSGKSLISPIETSKCQNIFWHINSTYILHLIIVLNKSIIMLSIGVKIEKILNCPIIEIAYLNYGTCIQQEFISTKM
jgi:phosphatidylserine synthase